MKSFSVPALAGCKLRVQNLWIVGASVLMMGVGWKLFLMQGGTTFQVTSTADAKDLNPGDGICDSGPQGCTLRAALEEANAHPRFGTDTIHFAIPGNSVHRIQPQTPFPMVKQPIIIDGTSQVGTRKNTNPTGPLNARLLIELNGDKLGAGTGLRFVPGSEGSVVRGLAVNGFDSFSSSGIGVMAEKITVVGCYIGTDVLGTTKKPNHIGVSVGSTMLATTVARNVIGGQEPADRNLIVGTGGQAISIAEQAIDTYVENNDIHLNALNDQPVLPPVFLQPQQTVQA